VSFLQPSGLLAALTVPLILILYMLKRKSRLEPVSSTMLWEKLEQFVAPAVNISRLRKNLLLFLQLAAALLLALALAQPTVNWAGAETRAQTTIIIVDTSISMAVQEQGGTRLDLAKQYIRDFVAAKGAQEAVAIIGMSEQARLLSGISTDSTALLQSVEKIAVTGAEAKINEALVVAENMVRAAEEPALVIISDGCFDDVALQVSCPVTYLALGSSEVENLLIENMVVDQSRLYLTVYNNGTLSARGTVQIKNSDGRVSGQREVALNPGEGKTLVWRALEPSPWYQGEIQSPGDRLSLDNCRFMVSGAEQKRRLLLVTAGNLFLERALMLQPSLSLTRVRPEHYRPELSVNHDLFIFDGFLPDSLPAAPVLVFDPPHPNSHLQTFPPAGVGSLLSSAHRLLTHVDLAEVRISFSKFLAGGQPLLTSEQGTLGAEFEQQGQPLIAFGFAVQAGDLPLRPAFPILLRNIMDYFTGLTLNLGEFAYGQPLILEPPYQVEELKVFFPGGDSLVARSPFPYHGPLLQEAGIYTLAAGDQEHLVAVNPPVSTGRLNFRETININGQPVAGHAGNRRQLPLHTPLLLLTLLLVGLEWWVDNRGY
jgi:Ca-activated chloride channel family protein